MRLKNEESPDIFLEFVKTGLDELKQLINGESINASVIIVFDNFRLPENSIVDTELGIIKNIEDNFLEFIPQKYHYIFKQSNKVDRGVFIELVCPYKVIFNADPAIINKLNEYDKNSHPIQAIIEEIKLAFSLAIEREGIPIGINFAGIFNNVPFGVNFFEMSHIYKSASPSYLCNSKELVSLEKWIKVIHNNGFKKIGIAIHRLLSAINIRHTNVDRFIDSLVALENLFSGKTDATFRMGISIALLLGKDNIEREDIYKNFNKLYHKRSILLHGYAEKKSQETINFQELCRCLNLLIRSLRALYEYNVGLLDVDSSERSKKIALGIYNSSIS